MSIFHRQKRNKNAIQLPLTLRDFSSGSNNYTGNDATSFACIDLIASSFASLDGAFYSSKDHQKQEKYKLYDVLKEPNIDETKNTFFYQSVKDYYDGNVYWLKAFNPEGDLISLFRLNPNSVYVSRNELNQKIYTYNGARYTSEEVLHIPSRYGYNGLKGKSIFNECRNIFSASKDLDDYTNNSFNNSIGKRVLIDISKAYPNATDEEIKQIKSAYMSNYSGVNNAGKPFIKTNNIELSTLDSEMNDNRSNQLIENREFQEKEISKLFGVPLPLLNGSFTSNLESNYTVFIENAIKPIALIFEESINRLIPINQRSKYYFEYSFNSLLKTSLESRISAYSKQIMNGMLTVNEVRRRENLSPLEAGDTPFVQSNWMPLTKDIVNSYMASAKLKQQDVTEERHGMGDDKL